MKKETKKTTVELDSLRLVKKFCLSLQSGYDQLNYIMGHLKATLDESPPASCSPSVSDVPTPVDTLGLPEVKLMNFGQINRGKLNTSQERVYDGWISNVLQHLCDIIKDPEAYVMVFVLVLLNTSGGQDNSYSDWKFRIQTQILTLLQKHLISRQYSRLLSEQDFGLLLKGLQSLVSFFPIMHD